MVSMVGKDSATPPEAVGQALFTSVMSRLAGGVAVVTSVDPAGKPVGFTSTAICSLSLDPPLMLVCIAHGARTLSAIRDRGGFGVSILGSGGREISERFARRDDDKFRGLRWTSTPSGMPVLPEYALAVAECAVVAAFDAGDHVIVVGRMVHGDLMPASVAPLLYHRGDYVYAGPAMSPSGASSPLRRR